MTKYPASAATLYVDVNGVKSTVPLEAGRYSVGRAASNELAYPNAVGLSREHMALERDGNNWVVRDLGSTNGSLVNGERISAPRILRSGDRIAAGQVNMLYREAEKPALNKTVLFTNDMPATTGRTTISESLKGLVAEESEEGGRHMRALITAGRELATHLPLDKLFDLILNLSAEAASAARGMLMTLENDELQVRSTKGPLMQISSHVRDMVIQERQSLLVADAMMDSALAAHASIVMSQIRSMMAVPLQTDDRVIGLIYLDSSQAAKEFTRQDLSLLTVMANMAAVRIENARLAEVEQAERVRARELEHAATIQRSILPSKFPPFPERKDFELHAAMVPAKEVGGDLFDFFLLGEDEIGFVLGDVSGKGVPAALFMAITRTLVRSAARHHESTGSCLTYISNSLMDQNSSGMFVTFFYGILNTRTGMLQYTNAGHNPPYAVLPDGQVRALDQRCGPMLGIFEDFPYKTLTIEVQPGEALILYTDGVTEATNKAGDFFDEARLEAYLAAQAARPVEELVRGLHLEVERFAGGAPRADDITILAVRRNG